MGASLSKARVEETEGERKARRRQRAVKLVRVKHSKARVEVTEGVSKTQSAHIGCRSAISVALRHRAVNPVTVIQ